ncbi:hypothetical protein FQP34_22370 [Peribacillus simplex]|uniref:Uncharacterized protein n=1 Tax=Peribacillus simplex TaxID=1478 RepID=A0A8B5XR45_9BACI|nr:hypothetical protein [Peribacillus simplex]TVX77171.1 hypothetical protein FQP34_22370 [Peribacillus simplex]
MEFTLLENGTDSLKKAKVSIEQFEALHRQHSYHQLKDAIIFLNHGIEILLKYILSSRNESLIFKDIKVYIKAKEQLKHMSPKEKGFGIHLERNMPTIFDVPERDLGNKKLETISLREALNRVEFLCDIEVTQEFKNSIFLINDYRNNLTHHSIKLSSLDEERLIKVLKTLYDNVLDFFEQHIPGLMREIDNERFEVTSAEWEEIQREMQEYYYERSMSDLSEDDY